MATLSELLEQRYGIDAPMTALDAFVDNSTLTTLLGHKSVRHFRPDPLLPDTLELLGAAAQSAASSSNLQTWSVIALQDTARKAEAAQLCGDQEFIRQAPLFLVFCADLACLTAVSLREGLPGGALEYMEMLVTTLIDTSLAAQNAAVAAESMGLGICYVGAARNHPQELAALLDLPQRVIALFGMAVGFPEATGKSTIKPRLPQTGILHHETYSETERENSVQLYNETMSRFYEAQKMNVAGDWSQHSAKRVATKEALMGRDALREILEERGFKLK